MNYPGGLRMLLKSSRRIPVQCNLSGEVVVYIFVFIVLGTYKTEILYLGAPHTNENLP